MKILLTGVNGYIGRNLLPVLIEYGHEVIGCVRNKSKFNTGSPLDSRMTILEIDFLKPAVAGLLPEDIDVAFYLIHSMAQSVLDFEKQEDLAAENFRNYMNLAGVKQVIYLGGITNETHLSRHLASRKKTGLILQTGNYAFTSLHAGIIVGSGSASFEIIRDLVEKLPLMVAPKWVRTRTQPVYIEDVIRCLTGVMLKEEYYNKSFDVAGPDVLTYYDMLMQYAAYRKLKRLIIRVPVLSPRLSSYWLVFVTSTTYQLAINLVDSLKVDIIARDNYLMNSLGISPLTYRQSLKKVFSQPEIDNTSYSTGQKPSINPPVYGCFIDKKSLPAKDESSIMNAIWQIGGDSGWYYANWLWRLRGWMDEWLGGPGMKRGRKDPVNIYTGDHLDCWKVLLADRENRRLLLYAEMKLPGEAWLEFRIDRKGILHQIATFRPRGITGRLYWLATQPFHYFIFRGMIKKIAAG